MFKGQITAGTYTSGYIPITQIKNTNNVFALTNNQVSIAKSGVIDVKANIVITATGTDAITAQLYGNGTALPNAIYTITPVSGSTYTLTINDAVLVSTQSESTLATVGIQMNEACTIVGGGLVLEYNA